MRQDTYRLPSVLSVYPPEGVAPALFFKPFHPLVKQRHEQLCCLPLVHYFVTAEESPQIFGYALSEIHELRRRQDSLLRGNLFERLYANAKPRRSGRCLILWPSYAEDAARTLVCHSADEVPLLTKIAQDDSESSHAMRHKTHYRASYRMGGKA